MNTEIIGIIVMFVATLLLAIPLGKYIAKVYSGERVWTDFALNPVEKLFFKISRINPAQEMNWKQHLVALLTINLIWFLWAMFCRLKAKLVKAQYFISHCHWFSSESVHFLFSPKML